MSDVIEGEAVWPIGTLFMTSGVVSKTFLYSYGIGLVIDGDAQLSPIARRTVVQLDRAMADSEHPLIIVELAMLDGLVERLHEVFGNMPSGAALLFLAPDEAILHGLLLFVTPEPVLRRRH